MTHSFHASVNLGEIKNPRYSKREENVLLEVEKGQCVICYEDKPLRRLRCKCCFCYECLVDYCEA